MQDPERQLNDPLVDQHLLVAAFDLDDPEVGVAAGLAGDIGIGDVFGDRRRAG